MITFIYGLDGYRVAYESRRIRDAYAQQYGNQLTRITLAPDSAVQVLEQSLKHRSLFDGPTLIHAPRAFLDHAESDQIEELLVSSGVSKTSDMLVVVEEVGSQKELQTASKSLFAFLKKKPHTIIACEPLEGSDLEAWIVEGATERGIQMSRAMARALVSSRGSDSGALAQEIDKLANYKPGGTIVAQDISTLVHGVADVNVFDLVDAIATKNKNKAFELLYRSLRLSPDAQRLMAPIIYQFRNLVIAKDAYTPDMAPGVFAKTFGLHPYVAQKTLSQARAFSLEDLTKAYIQLAVMDIELKSGVGDGSLLLHRFLLSL